MSSDDHNAQEVPEEGRQQVNNETLHFNPEYQNALQLIQTKFADLQEMWDLQLKDRSELSLLQTRELATRFSEWLGIKYDQQNEKVVSFLSEENLTSLLQNGKTIADFDEMIDIYKKILENYYYSSNNSPRQEDGMGIQRENQQGDGGGVALGEGREQDEADQFFDQNHKNEGDTLQFNQSSIPQVGEIDNISKVNNQASIIGAAAGKDRHNISMTDQILLNELSNGGQGKRGSNGRSSSITGLNLKTQISEIETGPHYKNNQQVVDDFFTTHQYDIYNYFTQFAQNHEGSGGGPRVAAVDIPLIIRIGFYIDNITFHASKDDKEELFNQPNSNQYILDLLETYAQSNGKLMGGYGKTEQSFDINLIFFSFVEFQDFLDYLIRQNQSIYLRHVSDEKWMVEEEKKAEQQKHDIALNNPVRKELKSNIETYQLLLQECQTEDEKKLVKNTLETLLTQLKQLDSTHSSNKSIGGIAIPSLSSQRGNKGRNSSMSIGGDGGKLLMTREQTRQKNLQQIFHFYCRQQYANGTQITFERIGKETTVLNLAQFIVFCKQFQVLNYNHRCTKIELQTLFQKTGEHFDTQSLVEFQLLLEKISTAMFESSDDENSDFEQLEQFYQFINLDLPSSYRQNMHIINTPFNIRDQEGFRLLPHDIGREIRIHQIDDRTKDDLQQYKDQKMNLLQKIRNEQISLPTAADIKAMTKKSSNASVPNLQKPHRLVFENYQQERAAQNSLGKDEDNQVSWQKLERISFTDMKQMKDSAFKPQDLFDENQDEEDQIYLAEYNLNDEKERKAIQQEENRKGAQVYGNLKMNHRPTQQKSGYSQNEKSSINIQMDTVLENPMPPTSNNKMAPSSNNNRQSNPVGGISEQTKARANQIDDIEKQKEQDILEKVIQRNDYQIGRGILAARQNKVV